METFTEVPLQAFFVLLGYFTAKQQFFPVSLDDVLPDLQWISDYLDLGVTSDGFRIPYPRTLNQQRQRIIDFTGYRRCQPADHQQAFKVALQAARVSPKRPYLCHACSPHDTTSLGSLLGISTYGWHHAHRSGPWFTTVPICSRGLSASA